MTLPPRFHQVHGLRQALARRPIAWLVDLTTASCCVALIALFIMVLTATGALSAAATNPLSKPVARAAVLDATGPLWRPEATVFVSFAATPLETKALGSLLTALDGVKTVRFVSREEALLALNVRTDSATAGILSTLRSNPLPDAFAVRFENSALPEQVDASITAARRLPKVDTVDFDLGAWQKAHHLFGLVRGATVVVVAVAVLLLAALGIRLATAALPLDAVTIQALRLVGATRSQIARPAVALGALSYCVATAAGSAAALIIGTFAAPRMAQLAQLYGATWAWPLPTTPLVVTLAVTIGFATVFGAIAASVCVAWAARKVIGP